MSIKRMEYIARKIHQLRKKDKDRAVFGAWQHKYKMEPVSLKKIETLEEKAGYRLPEDYRQWLLLMGSGAGPAYGLFSPGELSRENYLGKAWEEEDCTPLSP